MSDADVAATSRPLRVLILNWRDPKHPQAGGAETYLFELARRWVRLGHRVSWLTAGFAHGSARDEIEGIEIHRVGGRATVYGLIPLYYMLRLRGRFDVIVDSENGIPFFSPLFSSTPKVCVVYHIHRRVFEENLRWPLSRLFIWLELRLMPFLYRDSTFVTISPTSRDEMEQHRISSRNIPIVYSGVDETLRPGRKSSTPTILYLGRLKEYKRVDALVRAMPAILNDVPQAKLIVAGDGDQRAKLERLANEFGLGRSIEFAGFVDEGTKARLLREAWVLAHPSSMEGWGITVIEANACGTPAIVADSPGLRVAVVDGVSGSVVAVEAMAPEILRVLRDAQLRERLAAGASRRAAFFSWDRAAKRMLAVIRRELEASRINPSGRSPRSRR